MQQRQAALLGLPALSFICGLSGLICDILREVGFGHVEHQFNEQRSPAVRVMQ
jgi:hypothetical protein